MYTLLACTLYPHVHLTSMYSLPHVHPTTMYTPMVCTTPYWHVHINPMLTLPHVHPTLMYTHLTSKCSLSLENKWLLTLCTSPCTPYWHVHPTPTYTLSPCTPNCHVHPTIVSCLLQCTTIVTVYTLWCKRYFEQFVSLEDIFSLQFIIMLMRMYGIHWINQPMAVKIKGS